MAWFKAEVRPIGITELQRTLKLIGKDFNPRTSKRIPVLYTRVGRALRDDARNRITTQGEGKWKPLSKWTRAKTGRRKALITERRNIIYQRKGAAVEVLHRSPSSQWSLNTHAAGFTRPAVRKRVRIPLKQPKLLGVTTPYIILPRGSRASKTPARNVWGTVGQQRNVWLPEVRRWMQETMSKRQTTASLRGIRGRLGAARLVASITGFLR
jgi:hypothetical protein